MPEIVTVDGMQHLAAEVWSTLPPGSVVWLSGELGSGKTTFARALTRAAGAEAARSPTYGLVHQYASPEGPIAHVDLYRLRDPGEAADLELDQLARMSRLTLIEWPERGGRWVPPATVHFTLAHDTVPDRRRVVRA
jgi:tRNA threonylcarbamoyl adenosine modification protein YjeE